MLRTFSITVSGNVQGVFYRQSTREKAQALSITGTVANRPDGTVQMVATGTTEQLEQLVDWCKQGTLRAVVSSVHVEEVAAQVFKDFTIQR